MVDKAIDTKTISLQLDSHDAPQKEGELTDNVNVPKDENKSVADSMDD